MSWKRKNEISEPIVQIWEHLVIRINTMRHIIRNMFQIWSNLVSLYYVLACWSGHQLWPVDPRLNVFAKRKSKYFFNINARIVGQWGRKKLKCSFLTIYCNSQFLSRLFLLLFLASDWITRSKTVRLIDEVESLWEINNVPRKVLLRLVRNIIFGLYLYNAKFLIWYILYAFPRYS